MSLSTISPSRNIKSQQNDPAGFDDTLPAGLTLQTGSTSGATDSHAVQSQIRRMIHGPVPPPTARWYDLPPAGLVDIAGAGLVLIAGEDLLAGHIVSFDSLGRAVKADRLLASGRSTVGGIALQDALTGASVAVATPGALAPVRIDSVPAAASNGQSVWLASTGEASLSLSASSGVADWIVGVLQGADGITSSPTIIISPSFQALFL